MSQSFQSLSPAQPLSEIKQSNFPLPKLGPVLRGISKNLYQGTGLNLVRGFPIKNYDREQQIMIFLGLNAWVADTRLDQGIGRGIVHIKVRCNNHHTQASLSLHPHEKFYLTEKQKQSINYLDPTKRGKIFVSAQNNDAQMYHSDAGSDIVGLMALNVPGEGGESTVASAWRVYNHLAERRPDILRVLAERKFRWTA